MKEDRMQIALMITHVRGELKCLREGFSLCLNSGDDKLGKLILCAMAQKRIALKRLERMYR